MFLGTPFVFQLLLRLFPSRFRDRYAADMVACFEARRAEARAAGGSAVLRLWLRTAASLVAAAVAERWQGSLDPPACRPGPDDHQGGPTSRRWGSYRNTFGRDVRFALRALRRSPAFTAVAVLSLALGIGANTAIFSLVDTVLLRPLPVADPEQLVVLLERRTDGANHNFSYPDYADYRDLNEVFSGLLASSPVDLSLTTGGSAEVVQGELVSGNYFDVLGIDLARGRGFRPDEDRVPGRAPVAVVSDRLWRRLFGDDVPLDGRSVTLNRMDFGIVGVAPVGFHGIETGRVRDVWVPMMMQLTADPRFDLLGARRASWLTVVGRLRPGMSIARAQAGLAETERRVAATLGAQRGRTLALAPGAQGDSPLPARLSPMLVALAAGVALVLLVACANVAGLQLARGAARRRELGIQIALGASRHQLIRQSLTESVALSAAGALAGLVVARWTTAVLLPLVSTSAPGVAIEAGLDPRTLAFALGLTVATGMLLGLLPALRASRSAAIGSLGLDARTMAAAGLGGAAVRRALVAGQIALAVVLAAGAGLLLRTLDNLVRVDLGFDPANVLMLTVDPGLSGYDRGRALQYVARARDALSALGSVEAVGAGRVLPVNRGGSRQTVDIDGYVPAVGEDMELNYNVVDGGYFAALGINMVAGRAFGPEDTASSQPVVVVNETMAARYWPDGGAIGRRISIVGLAGPVSARIVGVARDGKYRTLREDARATFYVPIDQGFARGSLTLFVRTNEAVGRLAGTIQQTVRAVDPAVVIAGARTVADQVSGARALERAAAMLGVVFAAVSLLLAALGVYGVTAYAVARRTREIGIRMALGARPADVRRLVLHEGLALGAAGVAAGVALAWPGARAIESLLFGVAATDPATLSAAIALLMAVALAAALIPARRASRVDPVTALAEE